MLRLEEKQLAPIETGRAAREMENLDADDLIAVVEVEDDARRGFLRLDDLGIVESKVERVGFLIHD
jgi:hypothetical protein